ncbi:MAG: divergent polysaccharide deacetylase family protein [Desulfarculus sp.]|nr:divergent polysaccharide deacetylase family protein [Desulfarculus sp.]
MTGNVRARVYWALGLLLVLLGVAAAWFWQARPTPSLPVVSAVPPPFEESSPHQDHSQRLVAVDEAIFQGLDRAGLPADRIGLKIQPQAQGELTLVSARLRPDQDPETVAGQLRQALAGKVDRLRALPGEHGLRLEVGLDDRLTHVVSLLPSPDKASPPPPPPTPIAPPPPPVLPGAPGRPRVAIVIDDLGYSLAAAQRLAALGLPLGFSILPHSPHAQEIARLGKDRGLEILVHLPMEPRSYPQLTPGPGALLVSMGDAELRRQTQANLDQVPGAVGVNNHMGSRFTENPRALQPVLEVIRQAGLFFLDSATSPRSQAQDLARRMGLAQGQRDIFLDHEPSLPAVERQLERLLALARGRGQAIAIGHPHSATIQVLEQASARLRSEVDFVPVSRLLTRPGEPGLDKPAANP